jgi:hypothetical protein
LDTEADLKAGEDALVVAGLDLDVEVTAGQKVEDGGVGIDQVQENVIDDDIASTEFI